MSNAAIVSLAKTLSFDDRNLGTALYFMGRRDREGHALHRHMQYYAYFVSNIALTILRVINFIFGDHKWHNNKSAAELTRKFFQLDPEDPLRENQDLDRVMRAFHAELGLRNQGSSRVAYNAHIPLVGELAPPHVSMGLSVPPEVVFDNARRVATIKTGEIGHLGIREDITSMAYPSDGYIYDPEAHAVCNFLNSRREAQQYVLTEASCLSAEEGRELLSREREAYSNFRVDLQPANLDMVTILHLVYDSVTIKILDNLQRKIRDEEAITEEQLNGLKRYFKGLSTKVALCQEVNGQINENSYTMQELVEKMQEQVLHSMSEVPPEVIQMIKIQDADLEIFVQNKEADLQKHNRVFAYTLYAQAFITPRLYEELDERGEVTRGGFHGRDNLEDPSFNYKDIQDPYKLFKAAIDEAMEKFGLQGRSIPLNNHALRLRRAVIRLAVILLHKQARVIGDACHVDVHYSRTLKASYQAPRFAVQRKQGNPYETEVFKTDLFSTYDVGCDPEAVCRLMRKLNCDEHQIMGYFNDVDPEGASTEKEILCKLIDTMASQVEARYLDKVEELRSITEEESAPGNITEPLSEYGKNLRTVRDYMNHAFLRAAAALAQEGLVTYDDDMCYSLEISQDETGQGFIVTKALLEVLQGSATPDSFTLQLNEHVKIPLGIYTIYQPSEENPLTLLPVERRIEHELGGDGPLPPGDLIKAVTLFNRFTDQESKDFVIEYILRDFKDQLFRMKFIKRVPVVEDEGHYTEMSIGPDGQPIALTDDDRAILKRKRELEKAFALIQNPEIKQVIQELEQEVNKTVAAVMSSTLYKNSMPWLETNMSGYYPASPKRPIAPPAIVRRNAAAKYYQAVLLGYVTQEDMDALTIKNQPLPGEFPEALKIRENETAIVGGCRVLRSGYVAINGENMPLKAVAIERQYVIANNGTTPGSCMYGAIARKLWGTVAAVNERGDYELTLPHNAHVDRYVAKLREIVANYILNRIPEFRREIVDVGMGEEEIRRRAGESEQSFNGRLENALRAYCERMRTGHYEYGGDMERRAISEIFGVEIVLYSEDHNDDRLPFGVDSDGRLEGNRSVGQFTDRLPIHFRGGHFSPLIPRESLPS